jgi:hypothetical protein
VALIAPTLSRAAASLADDQLVVKQPVNDISGLALGAFDILFKLTNQGNNCTQSVFNFQTNRGPLNAGTGNGGSTGNGGP